MKACRRAECQTGININICAWAASVVRIARVSLLINKTYRKSFGFPREGLFVVGDPDFSGRRASGQEEKSSMLSDTVTIRSQKSDSVTIPRHSTEELSTSLASKPTSCAYRHALYLLHRRPSSTARRPPAGDSVDRSRGLHTPKRVEITSSMCPLALDCF